ncbi:SPW repeat domain-containing protein [Sorangium sp. So ce887]|uniref:SPW repeat domain-containing protein n=1 Tax=Sorangium sp. So ce887 TaxID=3133324 RepID=UPI003F5E602A
MKILSPRVHGYIDYAVAALFLLAPSLFGFGGLPETLCYILGAVHVGMTLLTAYPLGAAKIIPFPVHGALEAAVAVFLVAAPWLFSFDAAASARNFYLVSGVAVGLVWLVTDYRSAYATTTVSGRYRSEHGSFS